MIDGVYVIPLKRVVTERGHLMEVQRRDDFHFPGFGQVYVTCTLPGVIKAWYRHHLQVDQIALVKGELLLVLYDSRDTLPTYKEVLEITASEQEPLLIQIPPGVWHGFKAAGNDPVYLLHLNSIAFDFEATDEDRLGSDDPSIPYTW